ncbi:MAG: riboflavin biosynthesis protein RibF [Hyphomonadaceae bacterium]
MRFVHLPGEEAGGAQQRGVAVALGNFDGLHAGHRAVLSAARKEAEARSLGFAVATFEPAPRRYFQPDAPPFRILTAHRRAQVLEQLGVNTCFILQFDAGIATMSDEAFVETCLHQGMGAKVVCVGDNFRFGRGRMGDIDSLRRLGGERGMDLVVQETVVSGGERVSSTRVRTAIEAGDMATVREALTDVWVVDAVVEHGNKRGRTFGFPTANLRLGEIIHPAFGVYALWARIEGESDWRPAVANFGRTPTTGLRDPLLEVMIFDFDRDIYGARLQAGLVQFLRPELHFDSIEAMIAQMGRDVEQAKAVLASAAKPGA